MRLGFQTLRVYAISGKMWQIAFVVGAVNVVPLVSFMVRTQLVFRRGRWMTECMIGMLSSFCGHTAWWLLRRRRSRAVSKASSFRSRRTTSAYYQYFHSSLAYAELVLLSCECHPIYQL